MKKGISANPGYYAFNQVFIKQYLFLCNYFKMYIFAPNTN
jgi:hypothetical protein